jgi:hypothetical protein
MSQSSTTAYRCGHQRADDPDDNVAQKINKKKWFCCNKIFGLRAEDRKQQIMTKGAFERLAS